MYIFNNDEELGKREGSGSPCASSLSLFLYSSHISHDSPCPILSCVRIPTPRAWLVLIFFNRRVRHNIHSNSPCRQLICMALPLSSFCPFILVFVSRLPSFPGASAAQFSALDCWWDAVKGNDTSSFRLMKIRGFYTCSHKAFSPIWNAHTANNDWLKSHDL